ncbi:MAG: prenyltransferase/squalene oxidase repeat-containing protein [Patescibacteria group bacterium]
MKKIKILFLFSIILFSPISFTYAEDEIIIPEIIPPIIEEIPPVPILTENFIIRDGDIILFSGAVALPVPGMVALNDNTDVSHSINAQSVLSVLHDADILSADFSISNLEYYASFSSLYLKCITGTVTGQKCDNWQYTVNNSYPGIGMDQNILSGGENIYVYFGPQNKVLLSSNNINTTDTLTVSAQKYDYQNDVWITRIGVTVGLTQPDPNNPWLPIEIQTNAVDTNGQVTFSSIPTGSYNIGIKEDFYFPTEALIVTPPPVPDPVPESSSGSSGRSKRSGSVLGAAREAKFDLEKAFDFLIAQQKENGSFEEDIYTDWAILAFASSTDYQDQKTKLIKYLSENKLTETLLTSYERRSMALMGLGLNPYNINNENYIEKIIKNFDGIQFGDANLVNDDIFALIPLASSGYTSNDDIISKDIQFILSKQKSNGSWEESVDMTSAAIQALKPFDSVNGVSNALAKSSAYLVSEQGSDGGWRNVYATSWALQASSALGTTWTKNGKNGNDYLAVNQAIDGAVLPVNETLQNRIWATSYAVPAALGKSWSLIMHTVAKPVQQNTKIVANSENTDGVVKARSENKPEDVSNKNSKDIAAEMGININPAPQIFLASAGRSEDNIPLPIIIGGAIIFIGIVLLRFLKFIF